MTDIDIPLEGGGRDYIELCHLLKIAGLADSSGQGKQLVAAGLVCIDGVTETRKTAKIRAGTVVVCGDVRINVLAGG